ncbi:RES family NAD+ phosphorylase [Pleomorphomonas sp. NRKKF1]|nr:RES family NAD+ phosphorylase [Pleomorphomonas sp. NRK KF1]
MFHDRTNAGRFNAPDGSYGVLYAAETVDGAFAEVFLQSPGQTTLGLDFIEAKAYAALRVTRDLRLVELHGPGLSRLGATAEITHSGLPYAVAQAWSKAIHALRDNVDGIAYRSRLDDAEICYALFDRTAPTVIEDRRVQNLDVDWFWQLMDKYRLGIA